MKRGMEAVQIIVAGTLLVVGLILATASEFRGGKTEAIQMAGLIICLLGVWCLARTLSSWRFFE